MLKSVYEYRERNIRKIAHRYLPELAIWYWTTDKTKSSVTLINDLYRYDIINIVTGELLYQGHKKTLALSKAEVLTLTH